MIKRGRVLGVFPSSFIVHLGKGPPVFYNNPIQPKNTWCHVLAELKKRTGNHDD